MPRLNADVEIVPLNSEPDAEPVTYDADEYDYLSLINEETHGIPPLITKTKDKQTGQDRAAVAGPGERVLYVNPGAIVSMLVRKKAE